MILNAAFGEFPQEGYPVIVENMKEGDIDVLIGQNLRRIRTERGLSQLDVANAMKMDKAKISGYENGHIVMGKDMMSRFCKALGAKPWEFYLTDDAPVVRDDRERECLYMFREAGAVGVAEEIASYGKFKVTQARQTHGHRTQGKEPRLARDKRKAG